MNSLAIAATRISIVRGHVVVVDERHLDVELGEFRLPVGAKVFVAEAAGDLEIAVEARDHQELLVELGRLGQRIEMAGMKPAGDQEVARPFGRAAAQDRRLDLEKAQVRHRSPHELRQPVAQDEDLVHGRPSQVEVAIGQAQLFVGLGPVHLERGRRRRVVDDQLAGADLDAAGLEPGVLLAGQPRRHRSFDADDVLVAQLSGLRLQLRRRSRARRRPE